MKTILSLVMVCMLFMQFQCDEKKDELVVCAAPGCSIPAVARDNTKAGCGFLLELNDGTLLQPFIVGYCGTPPLPENIPVEPITKVTLKDGLKVLISYEPPPQASDGNATCGNKLVHITCIHEAETASSDTHGSASHAKWL